MESFDMALVIIQLATYGHSPILAIIQMIALVYTARSNTLFVIFADRKFRTSATWSVLTMITFLI